MPTQQLVDGAPHHDVRVNSLQSQPHHGLGRDRSCRVTDDPGQVDPLDDVLSNTDEVNLVHDDGREIEAFEGADNHGPQVHPVEDQLSQVKLVEQPGCHLIDIDPPERIGDDTVEVSALDRGRRDPGEVQPLQHADYERFDVKAPQDVGREHVKVHAVEDHGDH